MSDPWFTRAGWEEGPGLHAFIVGISAYAHLPRSGEPTLPQHFGLCQLSAPALTAYRLATVLKEQASQFEPPLATCRLLLSPSLAEIKIEPALEGLAASRPDHETFCAFAEAWRRDACRDPQGMTFFYYGGHGIERKTREHILLLHNFGSDKGAAFSNKAVNIRHLLDGMAASRGQKRIANKQVYFFDACRVSDATINALEAPETGNIWNYLTVPEKDERLSAWFFAAKAGGEAFANSCSETLFGRALLESLRGGAGVSSVKSDPNADYIITINSLHQRLEALIDLGNREAGAAQSRNVQFIDGNMRLLRLTKPPDVRVRLTVDPADAVGIAALSVVDIDDAVIEDLEPSEDTLAYELTAPAGILIVKAVTEPKQAGWRPKVKKPFTIEPPESLCPLSLK